MVFRPHILLFFFALILSIPTVQAQTEAEAGEIRLYMVHQEAYKSPRMIRAPQKIGYKLKSELSGRVIKGRLEEVKKDALVIDGSEFPLDEFSMIKARARSGVAGTVFGIIMMVFGPIFIFVGLIFLLAALVTAALSGSRQGGFLAFIGLAMVFIGPALIVGGIFLAIRKKTFDLVNEWDAKTFNWNK